MSSKTINYSSTSHFDKYEPGSETSYVPIELFMTHMQKQSEFSYYCDLLYIDKCEGEFPDLRAFKYARRVFITNCKLHTYPHTIPIPNWIESISIEFTEINEVPPLPINLRRLYISRTSLERLPDYLPYMLYEFIVEESPRLEKLPQLPNTLSKLVCVNTSIRELPKLPEELYILYCWNNRLTRLPEIPRSLRYLRCAGNLFSDMPWINLLHGGGPTLSQVHINRIDIETVLRFREIYYAVRFREQFKRWLWRPREREAMEEMNPIRLAEFVQSASPEKLDSALDCFYSIYIKQKRK